VAVTGSGQQAWTGAPLGVALIGRVLDGTGSPVAGVDVAWEVTSGEGWLTDPMERTGADGTASTGWILGDVPGPQSVELRTGSLPPLTFTANALERTWDWPVVGNLPEIAGLPDPLITFDGSPVTTAQQWRSIRRPELHSAFEEYMYGRAPPAPTHLTATTLVDRGIEVDGLPARMKIVSLSFGPEGTPPVTLLLVTPDGPGPFPVILKTNEGGSHATLPEPDIPLPGAWSRFAYARGAEPWDFRFDLVLARGYAGATFYAGEIHLDTDNRDRRLSRTIGGAYPHFLPAEGVEPGPSEWRMLAAWAWGLSRAVDHLRTEPTIDGDRIVVTGHSRAGKASLLAGAFDERIAVTTAVQSGTGGGAPSRTRTGETVAGLNAVFPWWMADTFKAFDDRVERLPFDQHALIAMVAPRPVLLLNATDDVPADPEGQFEMLVAASPVYELLGAGGISTSIYPAEGELLTSRLGYWRRAGGHIMLQEDWEVLLDYSDHHLSGP